MRAESTSSFDIGSARNFLNFAEPPRRVTIVVDVEMVAPGRLDGEVSILSNLWNRMIELSKVNTGAVEKRVRWKVQSRNL